MIAYVAPAPADERDRQRAVERSGVLRRHGDRELQALVDRAASRYSVPIAAISIIDRSRQWLAASVGVGMEETPRSTAFCAHAIHRPGEFLIVPDTQGDRRFAVHPLVTGAPFIRFYAGKPLVTRDGYAMGAFCIVDTQPHPATPDLYDLTMLAFQAERIINGSR